MTQIYLQLLSEHAQHRRRANRNAAIASLILALLAAGIYLLAIFAGVYNDRAFCDQRDYHLRVIEQFSDQMPRPNLSDYRSATGPGYHLALAALHRWVTSDLNAARVAGSMFGVALLALLACDVGRRTAWPAAVAVCLPMLTSLYVFSSSVWLLPDNLAWLTVLCAMLLAFRNSVNDWTFVAAAVVLACAVFVRQINLWPLGALVVSSLSTLFFLVPSPEDSRIAIPAFDGWKGPSGTVEYSYNWHGWRSAGLMLLMSVPAIACLAWFYTMWHGLVPPAFQSTHGSTLPSGHSGWQHEGPNLAVPAMVLAVFAATSTFFIGFLWPTIRAPRRAIWIAAGALVGAAAAIIPPTDFTPAPGPRYSGLWNLAAHFPNVAHRSLLMIALASAGGAMLMLWFVALNPRDRWIWLAAWACFIVAQTANAMAWHKYYEPFCLMMLALGVGRATSWRAPPRFAVVGPILLAALLGAVTLWSFVPAPMP